jgi:hypothetical protein
MLYLFVALMTGITRRNQVAEIRIWRAKELPKDSAVSEELIQTELLLHNHINLLEPFKAPTSIWLHHYAS